jgi:hypothetical protein
MAHRQPQTVVVVPVVRVVVVAVRAGSVVLIVVEGTAPQHLPGSLTIDHRKTIIPLSVASNHRAAARFLPPFC